MFFLSFKNGENDPTRYSFDDYYMPLVEIKDFNALIINWSASNKQTISVWKTYWNVKKLRLYNRKCLGLFVSSKIL